MILKMPPRDAMHQPETVKEKNHHACLHVSVSMIDLSPWLFFVPSWACTWRNGENRIERACHNPMQTGRRVGAKFSLLVWSLLARHRDAARGSFPQNFARVVSQDWNANRPSIVVADAPTKSHITWHTLLIPSSSQEEEKHLLVVNPQHHHLQQQQQQ
jgi:hypothetical protein